MTIITKPVLSLTIMPSNSFLGGTETNVIPSPNPPAQVRRLTDDYWEDTSGDFTWEEDRQRWRVNAPVSGAISLIARDDGPFADWNDSFFPRSLVVSISVGDLPLINVLGGLILDNLAAPVGTPIFILPTPTQPSGTLLFTLPIPTTESSLSLDGTTEEVNTIQFIILPPQQEATWYITNIVFGLEELLPLNTLPFECTDDRFWKNDPSFLDDYVWNVPERPNAWSTVGVNADSNNVGLLVRDDNPSVAVWNLDFRATTLTVVGDRGIKNPAPPIVDSVVLLFDTADNLLGFEIHRFTSSEQDHSFVITIDNSADNDYARIEISTLLYNHGLIIKSIVFS